MQRITVDFEKKIGVIKPFHAVNNAPLLGINTSLFHYLKDAGVPYSRLHDTGGPYGQNRYVDIENIFHNFEADPENPKSYDFAFTDFLLAELIKQGVKPFFRLGTSIENGHIIKAYRIFPPKDNLKWAKICEGIIKHYNNGWANGHHYDIKYWEIWNEPDNFPDIADNAMWKGTKEQYFELYETAANYLKGKFPDIKIGGYASCGFCAINGAEVSKAANASPRAEYFLEFFHDFMKYISSEEHKSPLDFFSWHSYDKSENNYKQSLYVRDQLNQYGFNKAENILNEWNTGIERRGTEEDACYISEMMCRLHSSPLDMLMYYGCNVKSSYCGLFNSMTNDILPAYYAFHAFNELYELKNEVCCEKDINFSALAASDGKVGKILIPNNTTKSIEIELELLNGWKMEKCRILDGINGLISKEISQKLCITSNKIVIIECRKTA